MAGFASFGMPMGNDNSAAAKKARKEGLARIALLKKKEMDTPTYVAGEILKFLAPNPQLIKQGIMDPIGTVRGAGLVASYASPAANAIRLIDSVKDNRNDLSNVPMSLLQGAGKDFMDPDVQQAIEIAGIIPTGKAVSVPLKLAGKGVSAASKGLLKGVEKAATRTSPDVLSAASGGLLRGSPVRAARGAPEPDEFDKIINAAKAEDPTLGDVAPEGTAPAPFRSEADWDEGMSVNYAKAVKKIMDDLEPSYQKLLDDGEDAEIIYPLIDDSIAALDSEIGNLTMRRYNHNDLEDFLGRVAAPDDYIVADSTLAKRADELVHEIGVEYERWGVDPEAWVLDTQFNMDAAKSAVKSIDKTPDRIKQARIIEGFEENPPTPEVVGLVGRGGAPTHKLDPEEAAFRANNAAEFIPEDVIREESEQTLSILGPLGRDDKPVDAITVYSMSREELLQRTRDALSSIKTRERNLNKGRIAKGLEPYKYEEHFNPDDFTLEEFRTLWGSGNMYAFNAAGEKIPELGKQLGHGAVPLEQGGSVTLGQVRGEIGVGNIRRGNRGAALDASKKENDIKKYLVKTYGADDPITKDPDVVEWIKEASIAGKAEKISDPSTWTTAQRAAYDAGDWRTFSALRGYTPDEIAQFEKYMMLSEKIAKKYEQDGVSLFDPDLEKFLKTL